MCVSEEEIGLCSYVPVCMIWLFAVTQQEMWLLVSDWFGQPWYRPKTSFPNIS